MAQGWTATLKEMLDIPPARFRLPRANKAGFKMAALSQRLWGNSTANLFHLSWTLTKFRNSLLKWCQIIISKKWKGLRESREGRDIYLLWIRVASAGSHARINCRSLSGIGKVHCLLVYQYPSLFRLRLLVRKTNTWISRHSYILDICTRKVGLQA